MQTTGIKWGWWGGGLGSILWLPIMAAVFFAQGDAATAIICSAIFLCGLAYLIFLPPWRFPNVPIRRYYLGFCTVLIIGAVVVIWQYRQALTAGQAVPFLALCAIFTPVFTLGRRSWSDFDRHDN